MSADTMATKAMEKIEEMEFYGAGYAEEMLRALAYVTGAKWITTSSIGCEIVFPDGSRIQQRGDDNGENVARRAA